MSEREDLARFVAEEFSRYGVTSIEFVDPDPEAGAARRAAHAAEEALLIASQWYEAGLGIRPPRKSGKVRGVARDSDGMELWHCEHDHAPGVRSCLRLTPAQRDAATACAQDWIREQQQEGRLYADWPVKRDAQ